MDVSATVASSLLLLSVVSMSAAFASSQGYQRCAVRVAREDFLFAQLPWDRSIALCLCCPFTATLNHTNLCNLPELLENVHGGNVRNQTNW